MATTYLTPGVYVEEVPSGNKPIEGVGTSIAAFVGLAPGGPVNRPMRISNWTQFATLYGDTQNPENGPFMEGSYLAHAVYGFFQNGGGGCGSVRIGSDDGATRMAALPAAGDGSVEAFRAVALDAAGGDVIVELSEEPNAAPAEEGKPADPPSYSLKVSAGTEHEEYDGLLLRKGKSYIVTKVNAASKLVRLEETGASLPDIALSPGKYTLALPKQEVTELAPTDFEGDVARREGLGSL